MVSCHIRIYSHPTVKGRQAPASTTGAHGGLSWPGGLKAPDEQTIPPSHERRIVMSSAACEEEALLGWMEKALAIN